MERVLIIDDDPVSLKVTQEGAVKAGYAPTSVQTQEEAISLLLKNDYACVVAEPAAKGVDVQLIISLAKTRGDAMPIIVVTRDASLVAERRLRELGVFYYMVKPVDVSELEQVFQNVRQPRLRRRALLSLSFLFLVLLLVLGKTPPAEGGFFLRSLLAEKGSASPLLVVAQAAEEAQRPEERRGFEERLLKMGTEGGVEGADLIRYERGQIRYQILQFIPPLLQSALVGDAFVLPPGAFRIAPSYRFVSVDDFFQDGKKMPGFENFEVTRTFLDLGIFYGFDLNRKYLHSFTAFLNIPFLISRADGFINPSGVRLIDVINEGSTQEFGDISFIVKKKLLDQANFPVQLAAAGGVFFPTGKDDEKFGDNGRVSVRAPRFPLLGLSAPPVGVPLPVTFLENLGQGTGAFPFNDGIFNRFSDDGRFPTPLQPGTGTFSYFLGGFLTRQFVPGNFALLGGWPGRAAFHTGFVHRFNFESDGIDHGDFSIAFASFVKPFYKDYLSWEIASVNFIQQPDHYRGKFIFPFNTTVDGEPAVIFQNVRRPSFNSGWTSFIVPSLIFQIDPQMRLAMSGLIRVKEPSRGPAPDYVLRLELITTFSLPGIIGE